MDKKLIGGVAAGGLLLAGGCIYYSKKRAAELEIDDAELCEAAIPTARTLKEYQRIGKSEKELAKEDAVAKLPKRPRQGCNPLPGSIVRDTKVYCPQSMQSRRRPDSAYPTVPGVPLDPNTLYLNPKPAEYSHFASDATRWEWYPYITVDDAAQLVSTQHVYRSAEYGVKVILIPTLRLADKSFFDSLVAEVIRERAVVLAESLHADAAHQYFLEAERSSNSKPQPYGDASPQQVMMAQQQAFHRGNEGGSSTIQFVGGQVVLMAYLQTLIEFYAHWKIADPGLSRDELENVSITTNRIESYRPLCHVREAFLMNVLDDCLKAASSDEEWQKFTGQQRTGEKVILLPWNGRHCARIERFLIESRGFKPVFDGIKDRLVFDKFQVRAMVIKAAKEDLDDKAHTATLATTPLPSNPPSATPPPHNFGRYAGTVPCYRLRLLTELNNDHYLKMLLDSSLPEEPKPKEEEKTEPADAAAAAAVVEDSDTVAA